MAERFFDLPISCGDELFGIICFIFICIVTWDTDAETFPLKTKIEVWGKFHDSGMCYYHHALMVN